MMFKSWCSKNAPDVRALFARGIWKCVPKDALLPEDLALHIEACGKHPEGAADVVRRMASKWLASDTDPKLRATFYEFACLKLGISRSQWLGRSNSPSWADVLEEARKAEVHLDAMLELADIWRAWGHGDEPSLVEYAKKPGPFVYIIVAPEVARIKIGYTTEPLRRFKGIHRVGPCSFKIIALLEGTTEDERALHGCFAAERLTGTEWFSATLRVLRFAELSRTCSSAKELLNKHLGDVKTRRVAALVNQREPQGVGASE